MLAGATFVSSCVVFLSPHAAAVNQTSLFKFQLTADEALTIRAADCKQFRNMLDASKLDEQTADTLYAALKAAAGTSSCTLLHVFA